MFYAVFCVSLVLKMMHQWQWPQSVAVTRKALLLHAKAFCLRRDP